MTKEQLNNAKQIIYTIEALEYTKNKMEELKRIHGDLITSAVHVGF